MFHHKAETRQAGDTFDKKYRVGERFLSSSCEHFELVFPDLLMKGRGANSVFQISKKKFNSSELGVLSTTANSNLGSVDTGTVGAVREEQKQDFTQNQDSVHRYS